MVTPFIVGYLFLAGTGGGAFLIGSLIDLLFRFRDDTWLIEVSRITDRGMPIGTILVAAGAVFLLIDLGSPDRVFEVFLMLPTNLLSLGSWMLTIFVGASFISLVCGWHKQGEKLKTIEAVSHVVATVSSLGVILYSGLYLSLFPTIPFLNSPFVPLLFIASALSTGFATTLLGNFFVNDLTESSYGLRWCLKADFFLLIGEALLLTLFLVVIQWGDLRAQADATTLISGSLAPLFWGGVIFIGLIIPFVTGFHQLRSVRWPSYAIGACCSLVGGFCLRYALLLAASRLSIIDPSVLSIWG